MSMPLTLTIFPPAECTCHQVKNPWTYYGTVEPGGAFEPTPFCPEHFPRPSIKRFSDAELAAEYWAQHHDAQHAITCELLADDEAEQKACSDWMSSSIDKADAIRRFATGPHYFEADQ